MAYFRYYPRVKYQFGDEASNTVFQDLSVYVDVIDTIKDNVSFYRTYTILDGDRPDALSQKLYGDPRYYWTFFLMNDQLREQGWPLTSRQLLEVVQRDHPNTTITTTEVIDSKFLVGQTVNGSTSGAVGTVLRRKLDLGQLIIDVSSGTFVTGEILTSTGTNGLETINDVTAELEYNATDHWEDSNGDWVDVDPAVGTSGIYTPITIYDEYVAQNDVLKEIRVLKPQSLSTVYSTYIESLET